MKEAKEDPVQQVLIVMILAELAKRHIGVIEPFIDDFMNPDLWQSVSTHSVTSILQLYGLGSEVGNCLNIMFKTVDVSLEGCALKPVVSVL